MTPLVGLMGQWLVREGFLKWVGFLEWVEENEHSALYVNFGPGVDDQQ